MLLGGLLFIAALLTAKGDSTFVYAVQISATLQTSPPAITLSWLPDPYGAKSYTIYRKSKTATDWGEPIAAFDGSVSNYTDTSVVIGDTYEYQIFKQSTLGYTGYGYIFSGIQAPLVENRGTVVLVVATNSTAALGNELARLQTDLVEDGWGVIRHDVSSNDTPDNVRNLIIVDYNADPANVDAVFLFGHVPVLHSGFLNYDGHYYRAMPADTFYGEMNNDWPTGGNPTNDPSYLPSDVALEVGRVDMFAMPGVGSLAPWPSETELLRNYLNKDHAWRTHQLLVKRQALMGNRRGDDDGPLAMAACGYRNFQPLVGPGNTIEANIQDNAPVPQRWVSMLASDTYLWAFGDGGGQPNSISWLGTNAPYNLVMSTDIVGVDAHAVFVMMFGSFFGNWDVADDIMRAVLATPTTGLAACMVGEPHWFFHHMGLGETIGYGTRLTMNNSTLYQNASNQFTRAVYIGLMGDPTLREDPIAPPTGFSANPTAGATGLSWNPSLDAVVGYHVYRSASPGGPFTRLTSEPVTGNNYVDVAPPPGEWTYMVRAVALTATPSGTYYNPSEGALTTTLTAEVPINLSASPGSTGLALTWSSQAGVVYDVQASASLYPPAWTDVSGPITATGSTTTWSDTDNMANPQRYYRIVSP